MDSAVFWTNSEQRCILIWLRDKAPSFLVQICSEPSSELPNSQAQKAEHTWLHTLNSLPRVELHTEKTKHINLLAILLIGLMLNYHAAVWEHYLKMTFPDKHTDLLHFITANDNYNWLMDCGLPYDVKLLYM